MPKAESSGHDMDGNLLAEADASKTITKYYIHGLGLAAMVVPGTVDDVYTYHFNAIGSTVALTDANQVPVNMYAYTPFGIVSEAEAIPQPFKYVGQYGVMHEQNGFYYMRARYYDPNVGRFVSEDPIKFAGGTVNLYEYVRNQPIDYFDPLGFVRIKVGGRIYDFHRNDHHGVIPPEMHVHDIESRKKIGVETGNIYDKSGRKVLGNIGTKNLGKLRGLLRKAGLLGVALTVMELYDSIFMDDAEALEIVLNKIELLPEEEQERILIKICETKPEICDIETDNINGCE